MEEDIRKETLRRVARDLAAAGQKQNAPLDEEQIITLLEQKLLTVIPEVTEVRPQVLECDVVRFQNNKEKWVALVGLLDGYPYEIFTGLQDDEEGIMLPKTVTHGKIIKQVNPDGTKRYDFQFENKRGYKTTVEGLSEKFNPEYWNYAKLISGVLRYRMPLEHVIKLVGSLSLRDESINTWKTGVERALKKYVPGSEEEVKSEVD
jgi:ribonucleoside-diphosphate reductase alpha chain